MNHGLMEGMWWAGVLLVAVPFAVGLGILVVLLRRRGDENDGDLPAGG